MKYVCAKCGLPIRYWYFGWKHSAGGASKPSCGEVPIPKEVSA